MFNYFTIISQFAIKVCFLKVNKNLSVKNNCETGHWSMDAIYGVLCTFIPRHYTDITKSANMTLQCVNFTTIKTSLAAYMCTSLYFSISLLCSNTSNISIPTYSVNPGIWETEIPCKQYYKLQPPTSK